jgi:decaprenylphospho-beta-D-erythro-pentofuranosid-2-ulose 2-reductase
VNRILIIGATSSIALEYARLWAIQSATFFLVGRNIEKLEDTARDLIVRGSSEVYKFQMDVNNIENHKIMLDESSRLLGGIDIVLISHGTLPNQKDCEINTELLLSEFSTNAVSTIGLLTIIANYLENQGFGSIGVITSIAGDRGRVSNYVYGSSKAAVSVFCDGLRIRLFKAGVSLTDIRPGYVDTPMTQNLHLPSILVSKPKVIAKQINKGIQNGKAVLYTPSYWAYIMAIIRFIPRIIFRHMKL